MRKIFLGIAAAGTALTALPAAAAAQPGYYDPYYGRGSQYAHPADRNRDGVVSRSEARRYQRQMQRYGNRYDNRYYGNSYGNSYGGAYSQYYDRSGYYSGPTWRGNDGRYYCRRSDGTTGTIVGGAAGALVGSQIAGRGDRTLGAIIGGAIGAAIGNEVGKTC